MLYNLKVTKGKNGLDKALKLAKKLKLETVAIYEITTSINKRLNSMNSNQLSKSELEDQLNWIKVIIALFIRSFFI